LSLLLFDTDILAGVHYWNIDSNLFSLHPLTYRVVAIGLQLQLCCDKNIVISKYTPKGFNGKLC